MIHSITLHTKDWNYAERFKLIKDLYQEILENDSHWHFFYEAEFGDYLRISEKFTEEVISFLTQYPVHYELTGVWEETLEFVGRNMNYFRDLFHMNSVFAITYGGDEKYLRDNLFYWIERYSHSLHDTLHARVSGGLLEAEATNLSRASLARSWYDGYRSHYLESKKRYDESNNNDT